MKKEEYTENHYPLKMDCPRIIRSLLPLLQEDTSDPSFCPTLEVKAKLESRLPSGKEKALLQSINPPLKLPPLSDNTFLSVLQHKLVAPQDFLAKVSDPLQKETLYRIIENEHDPDSITLGEFLSML